MEKASGFKDKVALVVGGASGMGNAVVRLLVGNREFTYFFAALATT